MITRCACALLAATLVLIGCGDDDDTTASTTSTAAATAPTGPPASGAVDEEALVACEEVASGAAPEQARDAFPDNPDVTWTVGEVVADPASGLVHAEITPAPDEVGYPVFRFISLCEGEESVLLGAYALDEGAWVLLFTTGARTEIDLAPELG